MPSRFFTPSIGTLAICLLAAATSAVVGAQRTGQSGEADILAGTIDIHVHADPDSAPRVTDGLEIAALARSKGMRGIVLKNHYESTAGLAYLARKAAPGLEVFGGIDLNLTVGGLNVFAIEQMTGVVGGWGRIVWMPTFDAENQVRYSKETRPYVTVARDGALLPETKALIATVAKHQLTLATGHLSPAEGLLVLAEARRQGVLRTLVTHATTAPVLMTLEQMKRATDLGAYIELVGGSVSPATASRLDQLAEMIRQVGPQFCILSSDLGRKGNPLPTDGFAALLGAMRARGFTDQELGLMTRVNPARVLGLRSD
jgi:uncharacterized protein DUF6282